MTLHSATALRAIAELLDAIQKFQCDSSHDLILIGNLDVFDAHKDLEAGQLSVTDEDPYYVPTTLETKENE
jgi:hypothetical protein